MSSIAARRANKRAGPLQPNGILSRGNHGILAQMALSPVGFPTAGLCIGCLVHCCYVGSHYQTSWLARPPSPLPMHLRLAVRVQQLQQPLAH